MVELGDFESYCNDAEDVVQFTEALFQVLKPGTKLYSPVKHYPYVRRYLRDKSDMRVVIKSRQTGFSWANVCDALHRGLMRKRYMRIFVSTKEDTAAYLISKAQEILDNLQDDFTIKLKRSQTNFIELEDTRSILRAVPSSAASTRGYNCDVTLDELAFMAEDKAIMEAILQGTVREGWQVDLISTPFGQTGSYYDIIKETGWDVETYWEHANQKAAFDKELKYVQANNTSAYSLHAVPWWECPDLDEDRARARAKTQDVFLQEYCLHFFDEAKAVLPYRVIRRNIDHDLQNYPMSNPPVSQNPRYMGVDPAEGYNETALAVSERIGNVWRMIWYWHKKSRKDEYIPIIKQAYHAFRPEIIYVDRTGMGDPITDDIRLAVPGKVEGIFLSNAEKEKIVYNLVSAFDSDRILIPNNQILVNQLHALRGNKTPSGLVKFTGKSFGKDDDLVWATGLAIYPGIDGTMFDSVDVTDFEFKGSYLQPDQEDDDYEDTDNYYTLY